MKLVELEPRWVAESGRQGQGLSFICPHCKVASGALPVEIMRLAVFFANPLDGGSPLAPRYDGDCRWQRNGDSFESLTLSPSVDASSGGCGHWHGFIVVGEIR